MLAKIAPLSSDFRGLARYLLEGSTRPIDPARVAWVASHNVPTRDARLAAVVMEATAQLSRRCAKPVYHLMLNWHPSERPAPEIMQEIARRTLEMAGLGEHQALVMGHGDTAHAHLHMMINRVHPETGRAWETKHDFQRFDRIMKALAEEYGFTPAPCHRFDPEGTADARKGPSTPAHRAARRGAATARPQWSANEAADYSSRLSEHLDLGATLDDVAHLAAEDGLTLEAKGKGFVIGDATSYVKLSALGLQITANGLAKRRPPRRRPTQTPKPPPPSRPWVDAIDIARSLASMGLADTSDVREAIQESRAERAKWMARKPLLEQLLDDMKLEWAASTAARAPPTRRRPSRAPPRPTARRQRGPPER